MQCPHCLHQTTPEINEERIDTDIKGDWIFQSFVCPNEECKKIVINILCGKIYGHSGGWSIKEVKFKELVYPRNISRNHLSSELIPLNILNDYQEACNVLNVSPKASAALSRRCLQNLLHNYAQIKGKSLDDEISIIISSGSLPTYIANSIDAIRNIGNYAAHPKKSISSGEIVDVEIGEAEWSIEVLETLFDFYFIQPSKLATKRAELNKKLSDMGKPEMK
ncbi:DUF4145 domain-containing protein [Leptospira kmetyi]|uniref:DUF4145 domain-containing protein n=1 Tax=Leptospira kmetyi TaxID=408139 RepID=UPI001084003E|nr:DUF4145 domain-containing protein [Leptospira kmetyi]TGL68524.1 DUF4145 domain-containing protein [Leptospira kmetyi]